MFKEKRKTRMSPKYLWSWKNKGGLLGWKTWNDLLEMECWKLNVERWRWGPNLSDASLSLWRFHNSQFTSTSSSEKKEFFPYLNSCCLCSLKMRKREKVKYVQTSFLLLLLSLLGFNVFILRPNNMNKIYQFDQKIQQIHFKSSKTAFLYFYELLFSLLLLWISLMWIVNAAKLSLLIWLQMSLCPHDTFAWTLLVRMRPQLTINNICV